MSNALQRDENLNPNNFIYILNYVQKQARKIHKLKKEKKELSDKLARCSCSMFPSHQFEDGSFICKKVLIFI